MSMSILNTTPGHLNSPADKSKSHQHHLILRAQHKGSRPEVQSYQQGDSRAIPLFDIEMNSLCT